MRSTATTPAPEQTGAAPARLLAHLDAAIVAYLGLPLAVFFLGAFRPAVGLALVALLLVAVWPAVAAATASPNTARLPWRGAVLVVALALAWSVASGSGHVVYAQTDWLKHDAVYADLSREPWPPTYAETDAGPLVLRYYEAYYVVPSAVTKVVGHHNVVMQLWTALGVALVALRLVASCSRAGRAVVTVVAFVVFGGMDLVAWLLTIGSWPQSLDVSVEMWNLIYREARGTMVQYTATSGLLAWVPHHALGGWLATLVLVDRARDEDAAPLAPLLLVLTAFWSVFAVVGLVPFVLLRWVRLIRHHGRLLPPWPSSAATAIVAVVLAAFLLAGSGQVPHGVIWEYGEPSRVLEQMATFYVFELAVIVGALHLAGVRWRAEHAVAVAVLMALPLYSFGLNGDLTMRSSIPALLVVFLALRDRIQDARPLGIARALPLVLVLLVASFTTLTMAADVVTKAAEPQAQSDERDVVEMLAHQDVPAIDQLMAVPPQLLQGALRTHDASYDIEVVTLGPIEELWDASAPVVSAGPGEVELDPSPEGLLVARTTVDVEPGLYRLRIEVGAPLRGLVSLYADDQQLTRPVGDAPSWSRPALETFVVIDAPARLEVRARDLLGDDALLVVHELYVERWTPRRAT